MASKFDFADTVHDILKASVQYEAVEAMTKVIPQVGKEAAKKLKAESPKETGKYARSWKFQAERGRLRVGGTVYAASPEYRLTHLLEKGHAKRGGGRTAPIVHIEPVEKWANEEAFERTIEELERRMR